MSGSYRCIITSKNAEGKSIVLRDERSKVGPLGIADFWKTTSVPASLTKETIPGPVLLEPPTGGTVFRLFEIPPQDRSISKQEADRHAAQAFSDAGAEHCRVDTSRNPMMHTTRTIDYVVVLSGEVTLLLDDGEAKLKPFDAVVQRGTNHYWLNHGDKPALLMGVLLDAK